MTRRLRELSAKFPPFLLAHSALSNGPSIIQISRQFSPTSPDMELDIWKKSLTAMCARARVCVRVSLTVYRASSQEVARC